LIVFKYYMGIITIDSEKNEIKIVVIEMKYLNMPILRE
jgi:hypothetical protein